MKPASDLLRQVQVAAASFSPRKFAIEENARRLEDLFRHAVERGARLALAPEGALDGIVVMGVLTGEWRRRRRDHQRRDDRQAAPLACGERGSRDGHDGDHQCPPGGELR